MQTETFKNDDTLARAGLYELYSRMLLSELDLDTLQTLHAPERKESLEQLEVTVPPPNEESVESLAIDYCKIFIGPKDFCPPYQSVWESGHMQSHVIDSMEEYLAVVTPNSTVPFKDHAGLQLELMSQILKYEADNEGQSYGLAAAFFRNHVQWTEKLFRRAGNMADSEFYRTVFQSAEKFIQFETQVEN